MPLPLPIPAGDCHCISAQWLRRLPGTPGREGKGAWRATWRIPPALFFRDGSPALLMPDGFSRQSRCQQGPCRALGLG